MNSDESLSFFIHDFLPLQKKNKKAGDEKAKSTKSQNTAEKVKKKSKVQAAFVVGEFLLLLMSAVCNSNI